MLRRDGLRARWDSALATICSQPVMALSWLNLPCALTAAIYEKADLGDPHRGHGIGAAWDARESGLWQSPPTASRRATLGHPPAALDKAGPGAVC
jgi:hypothetical protein